MVFNIPIKEGYQMLVKMYLYIKDMWKTVLFYRLNIGFLQKQTFLVLTGLFPSDPDLNVGVSYIL